MANDEKEYYYAAGKKVKLKRIPGSFAVRYKPETTSRAMERKLAKKAYFPNAEERKELPEHRIVIVTLPPAQRLADTQKSVRSLEAERDVEFTTPVYRESKSGLRLIATDEITVRFKGSISKTDIEKFNKENGVEVIEQNRYLPNQYLLRVKSPKDTLLLANKYQESDLTEFAEPNFISEVKKAALPNDEFINEQWHLHNKGQAGGLVGEDVRAMEAWEITTGSPDITIAIIDDGVDIDHPDLKSNVWKNPDPSAGDVNGWNFFDDNNDPRPRKFTPPYHRLEGNDSHGTPCAGVAAGVGGNASGISGISQHCKILPVKVFLGDDLVRFSVLADAIRYAGQRADVLSNSWGIPPSSDVEQAIKD
ncbi:MAG: S8 family serine peptidase, partial [Candidatus Hodarchaeota archaeon]